MNPHPRLSGFLEPYDPRVQELFLDLRAFVLEVTPRVNELIWDNYNALAIAYSRSEKLEDAFCHLALYTRHVNFGFNRGSELTPGHLRLEGKGKLIRHIKVRDMASFPREEVREWVKEALSISMDRNPALKGEPVESRSLVMSVSDKKRKRK